MKPAFHELERVFAPIADAVERCSINWGFRMHKCARGNSGWELVKDREEGGTVFLLLMYDAALGLGIGSVWQFRCPDMDREYTHFRPVRPTPIDAKIVVQMLTEEKDAILNVKFGYWTHIVPLNATHETTAEQ